MSPSGYLSMGSPLSMALGAVSIGSTIFGGATQVKGHQVNAEAQKLGIQGQMLQTMGQAFGFQTQAQQYEYTANIHKYQAAIAKVNKEIARQNAAYARDVGEVEAQISGMKTKAEVGEMAAAQGASGLDVNKGSAVKVRESMIELGYYNQALIRSSAAKKAYGYDVEVVQHEAQADVYRYTAMMNEDQAKNALAASEFTMQALPMQQKAMGLVSKAETLGVTSSLVSTVGSVANKWFGLMK
jgi:hypothetical protein